MPVPPLAWVVAITLIVALLLYDFLVHVRKAHTPTLREAAMWSSAYVGFAVVFGVAVWVLGGSQLGTEYFAGYLTEKALSVDNLFVFLVIMTSFKVPSADQQKVLLVGIVISLLARSLFILVGVTLIDRFAWVFYLFGLVLLVTAGHMLAPEDDEAEAADHFMVRLARRMVHTTETYDGDRLFTIVDGRRAMTPMLLVMVAIGGTDVMFALDSIPAIFGLTQSAFVVFTATAFSLMGLRQLYFLLDGLLDRLIYLRWGLAAILGFIGVKLILHALHENNVPFVNDGEPVKVIEVPTNVSLGIILATLVVTVVLSLFSAKGKALTTINNVRRHADRYLDLSYETDPALREQTYRKVLAEEAALRALPERFQGLVHDQPRLLDTLRRVHETHDAAAPGEADPQ